MVPLIKPSKSFSNSAIPPSTVSISLPTADELLAQGSARDKKVAPLLAVAWMMLSRSAVDRANLSKRVTTKVSPDPNDDSR
jgi:hypothetical protein